MQIPPRPALRHLDVHQVTEGGHEGIVLNDPLGLAADQVFVPCGLLPVVGRFDGTKTVEEIREEVEREHAQALPEDFVSALVRQLDERLLLLSPRFERALHDAVEGFTGLAARPPRHAGTAGYPAERDALVAALTSIITPPKGAAGAAPRGLVAPHIDLARGREGYAQAYGFLAETEPADLYVVFGTGHQGPGAPLTGLAMDWETPLGVLPTDRSFVRAVHQRIGEPRPLDLFLHRDEHSLEFQMLFLAHVHQGRPFSVAGFLTGGLPGEADGRKEAVELVKAVAEVENACGKRVCYLAGADLAHVGPFFGDPHPVDETRLALLERADRSRLEPLWQGRPAAFHEQVEASGNPDRICGGVPIYLTAALSGGPGELLHYGQAPAADGSQVVTFCSLTFRS